MEHRCQTSAAPGPENNQVRRMQKSIYNKRGSCQHEVCILLVSVVMNWYGRCEGWRTLRLMRVIPTRSLDQ